MVERASPIALASGGVAITNLKTRIMELRIGITITNHVTLIAGGSYRIIGKWHREDGMYVAKINDRFLGVSCSVKGKTVQTLKDEVKRTLEKHTEVP